MTKSTLALLEQYQLELGPKPTEAGGKHWRLTRDEDGIDWLLLDRVEASVNTLSEEVLTELNTLLGRIEASPPKGLVIRSAKSSGFIAGADIRDFRSVMDTTEIETQITRAHGVVDRLDALKIPTVAVIHGICLGGGLELALACKQRVALDGAKFGFPEVMLGLHPGLGGTARAMRLLDPTEAMSLMLTGRTIDARKAKTLGLVDIVTQERHVRNVVRAAIAGDISGVRQGFKAAFWRSGPGRKFAAGRMRTKVDEKAPREHYPAPCALIDLWEQHGGDDAALMMAERASFAQLLVTETAQNLIGVFFRREKLKSLAGKAKGCRHVHVVGAGAMGGDIAAWCALKGLTVTLADMNAQAIVGALKRAIALYEKVLRKRIDIRDALDRLIPDFHGHGAARADVVIEAVPERLDIKQKVYAAIEPRLKRGAFLATNTSSIPLETLRTTLKNPGRLVGLHFFNPVSRMQLVEVVSHDKSDENVLAAARAFVGQIDRLPAPVKSAPGFLVNRALTPYLLEAMLMLDEGLARETIDRAAKQFGMPMGPIELADQVGLDICLHVADVLKAGLERPTPDVPAWLRQKVEAGELGHKTGKGFYEWRDGEPVTTPDSPAPDPVVTDRLILPMLDVCVACLREGIIADPDIIDGAMVFATGFAPFRGGPLHYAKTRGVDDIVATLNRFAEQYGERFVPDPGWSRLSAVQ